MKPETLVKKLKEKRLTITSPDRVRLFFDQYPETVRGFLPLTEDLVEKTKPSSPKHIEVSIFTQHLCDHCGKEELLLQLHVTLKGKKNNRKLV